MFIFKPIRTVLLCVILVEIFTAGKTANILAVFPMPSLSHHFLGYKLIRELIKKEHNITFITTYPDRIPDNDLSRINVVSVEDNLKAFDGYSKSSSLSTGKKDTDSSQGQKSFFDRESHSPYKEVLYLNDLSYRIAESTLSNKNVQQLLKTKAKFDLILMEYFLNEAYFGLATFFDAPLVLLSTLPTSTFTNYLVGNPSISSAPHILSPFSCSMTWWERSQNYVLSKFDETYRWFVMLPKHRDLVRRYISDNIDLDRVLYNVSVMLVNSHPSVNVAVPHAKNVIEIGGFHLSGQSELRNVSSAKPFQEEEGVVVFSMGSNLNSADLPRDKFLALLKAFAKFPYKVVWKWEKNPPRVEGGNVEFVKWLPQREYLALPNIKAFITHGGLLSLIEAVYYGVPVVGIPIYGDQKMNIANAVLDGYALSVPYKSLTEETMTKVLNEIFNNHKYMAEAKLRSRLLRDQPRDPLDTAIYWIEYVIRYNGASHLKTPSVGLDSTVTQSIILILLISVFAKLFLWKLF